MEDGRDMVGTQREREREVELREGKDAQREIESEGGTGGERQRECK